MPYIYQITNSLNNKMYIGKTLSSIEKRWKEHCKDCYKPVAEARPLYSAMRKYGIENFTILPLEETTIEFLSERERYWIEYYGTFKFGYNATLGGDGAPYVDYDLVYLLWKQGLSIRKIHELTFYAEKTIRLILKLSEVKKEELRKRASESHYKPVARLDPITREILEVFSSIKEANQKFNGNEHISAVCKGKRKTTGGYGWKYL